LLREKIRFMKRKIEKIIAVLPAYNASKTLVPLLEHLPKNIFAEIIIVDDSSGDNTFELAKKQPDVRVFKTSRNLGYGGSIKLCFEKALELGADVVVEIHPDGEYLPNSIPEAIEEVKNGADLVLGNRFTKETNPLKSGMFWWKFPLIRLLNFIHNVILGRSIPDLHEGFRVYSVDLLNKVPFKGNSNDYSFTFEIVMQVIFYNFKIASVPVKTHYVGKKRGASLKNCLIYSIETFKILVIYFFAKRGVGASLFRQNRYT
jgi:glycosyltransferase involved in cell wall biosynthesis